MITIVEPGWSWVAEPRWEEISQFIEKCGRTCYKSEDHITDTSADKFVKMICRNNHVSVLEHHSLSVRIVCSRACSHQVVRHRLASYCLAGDTVLRAFGSTTSFPTKKWTIKQLYQWSQDCKRKGRLKLIRLRSVDSCNRLMPGKIKSIVSSGKQEVFEVKTKFGRSIKATGKHLFLTDLGWSSLNNLSVGDKVMSNGMLAYKNKDWINEMYLKQNMPRKRVAQLAGVSDACLGKWIHKFGLQKAKKDYPNRKPGHGNKGMFSDESLSKLSHGKMDSNNPMWRGEQVGISGAYARAQKIELPCQCDTCENTNHIERHHIDKNPMNNCLDNIMFLCPKCHKQLHKGQGVLSVFKDEIVSIRYVGEEETYDIEMEGENHNFVANGMVVHNSQESQRYCNYGKKGFQAIAPPAFDLKPGTYSQGPGEDWYCGDTLLPELKKTIWLNSVLKSYNSYCDLIDLKIKPEDARFLLPNACKTELIMTMNLRMWRHVFQERALNPRAQWEIRGIFKGIYDEFSQALPAVFGDLE